MQEVLEKVRSRGSSRSAALREAFPGKNVANLRARLRRFERNGVAGLLNAYIPQARVVLTPEVRQRILGMIALDPLVTTPTIVEALGRVGIEVGVSTVNEFRREAGVSQPRGRRPGHAKGRSAEPMTHAGAMLMWAAEAELGAVAALTEGVGAHMEALPEPLDEPIDDRGNRDEEGRFLPAYNAPRERTSPELGGKFETSSRRAGEKDLRAMRVANSSFRARYRKDLSLTFLPMFVDTARWSSLRHWQGAHLGEVTGFAYQPSTPDKLASEMKLAGASHAAREAVAEFWLEAGAQNKGRSDGMAVVYVDASVKPVWTRLFSKSARVSKNGRVMPATTTMVLHGGTGTPLVFRSYSGTASLAHEVPALLREVESATGAGTVRRLVVLDREGHSIALFKELMDRGWQFVVPLRSQVTGPKSDFEQVGDWVPYGNGDEVCEGWLTLKDRRPGHADLRIRVVGRRRARTGKVFFLATNTVPEDFDAARIVRTYFARWPLQEHVFRDGNGRVGLGVHHGYGKEKVANYTIIDALERGEATIERLRNALTEATQLANALSQDLLTAEDAVHIVTDALEEAKADLARDREEGATSGALLHHHEHIADLQDTLLELTMAQRDAEQRQQEVARTVEQHQQRLHALEVKQQSQQRQREVFTVDVELDEIMTAYKLTFMNLARHVMDDYLGKRMELDTLIRAVLTLPGERVRTPTVEIIRVYDQPRDPNTMALVEAACARVNELDLQRGRRKLRFELATGPGAQGGRR